MKTITKHLKRTETLCENNRKQQLTSTLYWVKFVSYLLLDKAIIILYVLYFNVLCIISILLIQNCVDKGIPVIVGEYCAESKNRTKEVIRLFCVSVTEAIYSRGMCPMLWDTPGGQYNRQTCQFDDPLFLEEMMAIPVKYPRN